MDSIFSSVWYGIFSIFESLCASMADVVRLLTSSLSDLIGDNLLGNLVGSVLPDFSLLEFMFGTGVSVFIAYVLIKFFIGVVTGS